MSFLAQLRQRQTAAGQQLSLCYFLEIHQQRAELSLSLTELRNGRIDTPGKPYIIQRPHLLTPPPFFASGDSALLQTLVEATVDWLRNSSGPLPQCCTLLEQLLASGRCFIRQPDGRWATLHQAPDQPVRLHWITDNSGAQRLGWQAPNGGTVFCAGSWLQPFIYHSTDVTISRCRHNHSDAALQLALPRFQPQPPDAIALLLQQQQQWRALELPLPQQLSRRDIEAVITPVLRFSSTASADSVQLLFRYCSEDFCTTIDPHSPDPDYGYWDGRHLNRLRRRHRQEAHWRCKLTDYLEHFTCDGGAFSWYAQTDTAWCYLLTEARTPLQHLGFDFVIAAGFRHHYIVPDDWRGEITSLDQGRWRLSVQLAAEGGPVDLLALLPHLKSIRRQDTSCLRLEDGRLLLLPADRLNGLREELGDMLSQLENGGENGCCFSAGQTYRLDQLRKYLPETTEWQGEVALLEEAEQLYRAPALLDQKDVGIRAQLRPYQWQGVCWLQHLRQHRVNGLLADDMGLGKTLQTLAHLCLEQQQGRLQLPALIVAPTSLLHNWAAEISRFAPHLRTHIMHGPQRHQYWTELSDYSIVISSYTLIVNDLEYWQRQPLSWVVLDEAQWIKNPYTQTSRAVRGLNAHFRLCLSGTPVENHLGELWSMLDFLMPGCLGSSKEFKQHFRKPIEQDADSDRLQLLLRRIAPFLLRRSKDQVARDLPAKTEIHQTISLPDDQLAFYQQLKTANREELEQQLSETPQAGQQRMLLLTALLKLRQACCDPQLLGETGISSGKRRHCIEMIAELVAEHRCVLVFSQFTTMLELLALDLEQLAIPYLMLTGQSRRRQSLVDDFQNGKAPVFLISLKAGGTGLNLTRADTVIHYDPWWNTAAEQQAADRAHRIGQEKPVFVYKLIAEDTIEEKIAELQQRKSLLSQHILQQAQLSGEQFALNLEELLALWKE